MTQNESYALFALQNNICRRDKDNRVYYSVPSTLRRNGRMIIPDSMVSKFLKQNKITQKNVKNIIPY